jgi:hypothetical protein
MQGIERQLVVVLQKGARALNRPNRRFVARGTSPKEQHCFTERIWNHDFIVPVIKRYGMGCPCQACVSAFNNSDRGRVSIRQPGEYRNTRVGHSVGHQDLLPHRVIGDAAGIADTWSGSAIRRGMQNP